MKNTVRFVMAALLLSIFVFNPADLRSCGYLVPPAVFTDRRIPPVPEFVRGQIGVLLPSFTRRFLFVAYRYLSGQPLTDTEAKTLMDSVDLPAEPEPVDPNPATEEWVNARNRVSGLPQQSPYIPVHRSGSRPDGEWLWFLNCADDAFRTAAHTLDERIGVFGADSPAIRDWVTAQDMVFSNCSEGERIPPAPQPQLPPLLRYDREYQIAAAHFYAIHYDAAAARFRAIAADSGSPWSTVAPYLAVRCLLRKATVPEKYRAFNTGVLEEARKELVAIQKDGKRSSLHDLARRLESFVDIRLKPDAHLLDLSEKLARPAAGNNFGQNLTDYLYLLENAPLMKGTSRQTASNASDMTDWIWTFSTADKARALERWKATRSAAWLIAVLAVMRNGDPDASVVMKGAEEIPKQSPAYATVQFHRIRLLMESGRDREARAVSDELLPEFRKTLPNSSLNLFLEKRLKLARNFQEFLAFAPRIPQTNAGSNNSDLEDYSGPATPLLDSDSASILNRGLPLNLLSSAALGGLPPHIRKQLIRAAWVRSALIADQVPAALSRGFAQTYPEIEGELKTWREAEDPATKRFALAMLLMHFPGMTPYLQSGVPPRSKIAGIDSLRQNWWCGFNADGNLDEPTGSLYNLSKSTVQGKTPAHAELPAFLSASEKKEFLAEWKRLAELPTAPNYFGKIVLAWAAKHPDDPRLPEALHLVVKSTRFGCTDPDSGRYSQEAFQTLHSRYPKSKWAEATPYWFK